ncbi:MAG: menaquinone biosynthesis protein [Armatimonadetes bacterium]|nr:menaquinone biosynthesis protein [Armatimonadota bacterium]MDW8122878.1 menaquinone biosynthesis protein [Armatimonadota bacterium]
MTIGTVPYLNAVPLVWGLPVVGYDGEVCYGSPAELASWLQKGEIDGGLIPIAEYFQGVGDAVVDGIALASDGAVGSVLLVSKIPTFHIQSVSVDRGSRTSVLLLRILLAERYGVYPVLLATEPDVEVMLRKTDAALLIGDAALALQKDPAWIITDLGAEWKEMTGLPFVFAAWALREGSDQKRLARLLTDAKQEGIKNLPTIIAEEAERRRLDRSLVADYLTSRIQYDLTDRHLQSIYLFAEKCRRQGLIKSVRSIRLIS